MVSPLATGLIAVGLYAASKLIRAFARVVWPTALPGIPCQTPKLFGDSLDLVRHVNETGVIASFLEAKCDRYGPICQVRIGSSIWVILSDLQEIIDISTKRAHEFDRAQLAIDVFSFVGGPRQMIAMHSGAEWKAHRRLLSPLMSSSSLDRLLPRIHTAAVDLIGLWRRRAELAEGAPFAAAEDLGNSVTEAIISVSFGISLPVSRQTRALLDAGSHETARPALFRDIDSLFEVAANLIPSPLPIFTRLRYMLSPSFHSSRRRIYGEVRQRMKAVRHEAELNGGWSERADNVLEMLVAAVDQEKDAHWNDAAIEEELLLFLAAGAETTSTTLQWACKLLSSAPDVQDRLFVELNSVIGYLNDRPPTYHQLSDSTKLPYLHAVVHEILRLGQPVTNTGRDALVDTTVLGHVIPRGTMVICLTGYDATRSKAPDASIDHLRSPTSQASFGRWSDPGSFDPSRWLDDAGRFDANAGPLLAFGTGPRGCYGKQLASMSVKLWIAAIILNFKLDRLPAELAGDEAVELITHRPLKSFVKLTPRS